jgi:hypothetical protein
MNDCWIYKGYKSKGYGQFMMAGERIYAHRYSFQVYRGDIPKGYFICHTCDNPPCINPDHLFLGTQKDNVRDMISKGRKKNQFSDLTKCKLGHDFTDSNTKKVKGGRSCRICQNRLLKEHRERKKHHAESA